MFKFYILFILILPFSYASRDLTTDQKLSDLTQLVSQIKSGYGPKNYKKEKLNIDIDVLQKKYSSLIAKTAMNSEFYYLMLKFAAEFKDSHFRVTLPTNFETFLGFTTDLVEDRVVIDEIDRKILPLSKFPFKKGDELISMDKKRINIVLEELIPYMGQGHSLTAKRRAAFQIANRRAAKVPAQSGKVKLEIKNQNEMSTRVIELAWLNRGTYTDEFESNFKFVAPRKSTINYDLINIDEQDRCLGRSKIKIPASGSILIKEPFVAYTYSSNKGLLGYIRIPHYSPEAQGQEANAKEVRFSQYEKIIQEMESKTVGLIIDQTHNCGGSVDFMQRILSLFMMKPFKPLQFELLATKGSLVDFEDWATDMDHQSREYSEYSNVINLVKDSWLNGKTYLTPKTSLSGEKLRNPNKIHYTKPIIVLIDELSASGGDAFPALIQGYGRAKLLGVRTMGAGGHVADEASLNYSQIKITMTKSLFYRPDGVAIENNGASPDIPYSTNLSDFKNGYVNFQKFYTGELLKMIK